MGTQPGRLPRARKWTDDDLRAAVASQRSWRGVARALGLQPTSTDNVRHHATRLALDTSHFSGKRPWSDQELHAAIAASSCWRDVASRLGVTESSVARVRLRGHATRLGLDTVHLDPPAVRPPLGSSANLLAPQPEGLRHAAAAIASAWFALRGVPVSAAPEGQAYDLLVQLPEGFHRVQVKSTTCRERNGRWLVSVGRRPYALDKSANRAPYDPESLDYYFIVTGDGSLYLVPSRVLAGRTRIHIDSYPEYLVGDAASLLAWPAPTGEAPAQPAA